MADSKVPSSQPYVSQVPADRMAGKRTFTDEVVFNAAITRTKPDLVSVATLAAAGSVQGDATAITGLTPFVVSTGGDGAVGSILPAAIAGTQITIYNSAAGGVKVYPASGGTINGGSANAAVTVAAKGLLRLTATSATNWAG